MKLYPTFSDVSLSDTSKDLNTIIYMLHHLDEELFSKEEIKEVCFSLKVALNTLEKMKETKTK